MKKSIVSIVAVFVFLSMAVAAFATVTPTLNIQGTHGSYIWSTEYFAPSISIGMQTDEDVLADWWFLCLTPSGWKYYHSTYQYWFDGCYPVRQGSLYSFEQTVIPTAGLDFTQSGSYLFFFGADKTMNGQVDTESLAYDIQSVNVFPGTEGETVLVTIFDSFQIMVFNRLSDGGIYGFSVDNDASPIDPAQVKKVKEVSDRVGWTDDSVATVDYDSNMAMVVIPSTANNDKCEWVLELYSGEFAWANSDNTAFAGKTATWNSVDGLFEYGNYKKQAVYFYDNGDVKIDFASNLTDGLCAHVNPADILEVRWNSDAVGWKGEVSGTLQVDNQGNYYVLMSGLPTGISKMTASDLFSVVPKNGGDPIWANVDKWDYFMLPR
jgi:hypothetical protein